MPSASSLFLQFLYFRNLLLEIFLELDENLRRFFMRNKTPEDQRAALGATHRAGTAPCCRGGINDISINDGKSAGQGSDGVRAGLGDKHEMTRDVPRFGALVVR